MLSHVAVVSARTGETLAVRRCRAQWPDGRDDLPWPVLAQLGHALVRTSAAALQRDGQRAHARAGRSYDYSLHSAARQPAFRLTTAAVPTRFGAAANALPAADPDVVRRMRSGGGSSSSARAGKKGKAASKAAAAAAGAGGAGGAGAGGAGAAAAEEDDGAEVAPLAVHPSTLSFVYRRVREGGLFLVAVSRHNANAAAAFELLLQVEEMLRAYCYAKGGLAGAGGQLTEASFLSKQLLASEILEEAIDWGWPQHAGLESIKPFVTQKILKGQSKAKKDAALAQKVTVQATGAIPWRNAEVRHKNNEIYIDIVEDVHMLVSAEGKVLSSHVTGAIQMKVYLSGMPECKFGLNDRAIRVAGSARNNPRSQGAGAGAGAGAAAGGKKIVSIDNAQFHQCVRLGQFESDRTISFVPPEGEFTLMSYRTSQGIQTPFKVIPIIKEHNKRRIECNVTVKSLFPRDKKGEKVVVRIPVPENVATCKITYAQKGRAKYTPEHSCITWKIRQFAGGKEYILAADVLLAETVDESAAAGKAAGGAGAPAAAGASAATVGKKANRQKVTAGGWSRPPISLSFSVPSFTASGLEVKFLKVLESKLGYNALKWVRSVTKADSSVLFRI